MLTRIGSDSVIKFILGSFLILFLGGLISVSHAESRVQASLSAEEVSMEGSVVLTLSVEGEGGIDFPKLPPMEKLSVVGSSQSSQFSWINGKVTNSKQFQYTLMPRQPGLAHIPSLEVTVGGQIYRTQALSLKIVAGQSSLGGAVARSAASAPDRSAAGNPEVFLQALVSNLQPYVGEQIIYRVKFYRRVNLASEAQYAQPAFKGFLVYPLDKDKAQRAYMESLKGINYHVDEVCVVLVPTTKAELIIPPASITAQFGFFDPPQTVKSKALHLIPRVLPGESPSNFHGGIGDYTFQVQMDTTKVAVGEMVNVDMKVSGEGNIKEVSIPDPVLPEEIKKFDAKESLDLTISGNKLKGTKHFQLVLIPGTAGTYRFDPVTFSYFSPSRQKYVTLSVQLPELTVSKGKESSTQSTHPGSEITHKVVSEKKTDINYINDRDMGGAFRPAYQSIFFIGSLLLLLVMLLGNGLVLLIRSYQTAHSDRYKRSGAIRKALRRVNGISRQHNKREKIEVYFELNEALRDLIADRFATSAQGLTRSVMLEKLASLDIPAVLTQRFTDLIDRCDQGRFAPGADSDEVKTGLIHQTEVVLNEFEKYF